MNAFLKARRYCVAAQDNPNNEKVNAMRKIFNHSALTGPVLALGLLHAPQAQAHAALMSADPAVDASLDSPPKLIWLRFSEAVERKFSHIILTDMAMHRVELRATPDTDSMVLAAVPTEKLRAGSYKIDWTAVASDDGHKTRGSFQFLVK